MKPVKTPKMHQLEKKLYTVEDLMALPDNAKAELIHGDILMMAPAMAKHSVIAGLLTTLITWNMRDPKKKGPKNIDSWWIIPEAWTLYDETNAFVHDIAGFSKKDLPKLPDLGPIHMTPKWVCEIISRSNSKNDTQHKKAVLEHCGVPYYWLIDPIKQTLQVFELLSNSRNYQLLSSVGPGDLVVKLAPFHDLELDLNEIFF